MNGLHGIIFAYEKAPGLRELTEARMPGSVPFGGRDFIGRQTILFVRGYNEYI